MLLFPPFLLFLVTLGLAPPTVLYALSSRRLELKAQAAQVHQVQARKCKNDFACSIIDHLSRASLLAFSNDVALPPLFALSRLHLGLRRLRLELKA
jgi:hypothetical protein